jgi:hypothetical protein
MDVKSSLSYQGKKTGTVCPTAKVLKKVCGLKRHEDIGRLRKLKNEELHTLNFSPSIVRVIKSTRIRRAGHKARMRERKHAYKILVGKSERKKQIGRPPRR